MPTRKTAAVRPAGVDAYYELARRLPLRPIRSEAELDRATAMIDELLVREVLSDGEADYLDMLGDLVEKYEAVHHPITPASDAAMLRHLIEAHEVTQACMAAGAEIAGSTISGVLAGRRKLNRDHIMALARFFKVSPAAFLPG